MGAGRRVGVAGVVTATINDWALTQWHDWVKLRLYIRSDITSYDTWGNAQWGADHWAPRQVGWKQITCEVFNVSLQLGRATLLDSFDPSSAKIVADNDSGWASWQQNPDNTLNLQPGRQIQITYQTLYIDGSLAEEPLWTGYIESLQLEYDGVHSTATLDCVDALSRLAMVTRPATEPVRPAEPLKNRFDDICNKAGWAGPRTYLQTVNHNVADTNYQQDLLAELATSTFFQRQAAWADRSGGLVIGPNGWSPRPVDPASWFLFRNGAFVPPTTTKPIQTPWAAIVVPATVAMNGVTAGDVYNQVILQTPTGPVHLAEDTGSQSIYGVRTYNRTDGNYTVAADGDALAAELLSYAAWPAPTANSVELTIPDGIDTRGTTPTPAAFAAMIHNLAGITPGSWGSVSILDDNGGGTMADLIVTAVEHTIDYDGWTIDVSLDSPNSTAPTVAQEVTDAWPVPQMS